MFFSLPESDFVTERHVNLKDDSIGRYAEQLLDHVQCHTGTMFLALSQPGPTDQTARFFFFCCFGEKLLGMTYKKV